MLYFRENTGKISLMSRYRFRRCKLKISASKKFDEYGQEGHAAHADKQLI